MVNKILNTSLYFHFNTYKADGTGENLSNSIYTNKPNQVSEFKTGNIKKSNSEILQYMSASNKEKCTKVEDSQGRVIELKSVDERTEKLHYLQNFYYNAEGQITKQIISDSSGLCQIQEYYYDEAGNKIKTIYKNNKAEITSTDEAKFNEYNQVIKRSHRDEDGNLKYYVEYKYNDLGETTDCLFFLPDGTPTTYGRISVIRSSINEE